MTREEAKKIVMTMTVAFPNYRTTVPLDVVVDIWAAQLTDYPYEIVSKALSDFIKSDTKGFAPSIGQIVNAISAQVHKTDINESEAWGLVVKAVRNANYCADEEFEKLPALVKRAIGSPAALREYAMMDLNDFQTVQKALFQRVYRGLSENDKAYEKTSSRLLNLVEKMKIEGEIAMADPHFIESRF